MGGVYAGIPDKVGKGQAHRIVLNLGDSPVRPGDIQQALRDNPIQGLQEVILIDSNGAVHKTFPNGPRRKDAPEWRSIIS